jgi:hypothetical protein
MAPENYYGDEAAPDETSDSAAPSEQPDHSEDEEQTALVDKALCPDMKVGDKFTVEIKAVYEKEYEVAYSSPDEKTEQPKSTMDEAEGGLDRMAKPPMEA